MNITEKPFGANCKLYTVDDGKISFSVTDFGCTITNLFVPDKNGKMTDVLLGYDTFEEWKNGTEAHNALVGRVANRIADGKFTLDGKTYTLDVNNGQNCLHGGNNRFEKMVWDSKIIQAEKRVGVHFSRISKAMEQGFPCDVKIDVEYFIDGSGAIYLDYNAKLCEGQTGSTPINLTNHAYFNLNGFCESESKSEIENVLNHEMKLNCDSVLEINEGMIPTGKILSVKGTEFDFCEKKSVGKDISKISEIYGGGYDHCFVTKADESKILSFGEISSPITGIKMEILTNQRGVQIYTGNYLSGIKGKNKIIHNKYDGICFETQRFPDCINRSEFPSCLLKNGEEYVSKTIYKFSIFSEK